MELSIEQELALKKVEEWFSKKDRQIFRLFGYAGTGKTTLAKYFAEMIDKKVRFAAFTGKAAKVLQSKGAVNASTIHSLIYIPIEDKEDVDHQKGTTNLVPQFILNKESVINQASLVIIDECSMVDKKMGQDLLSFGVPILVLGDPGQLPPIDGAGFFTNHEPDILLQQIHRQAQDNPILKFSKMAREGQQIPYGDYGAVKVIKRSDLTASMALQADQILVGRHVTRRSLNTKIRKHLKFDSLLPVAGDKLVAQRNDKKKGLFNGSCWNVLESYASPTKPYVRLYIASDDEPDIRVKIKLLKQFFEQYGSDIPWQLKREYDDFDYSYAMTVHKAQGSQWDNVLLMDESGCFAEEREKWLYTAITRAAKTITIVR